MQCYQVREWWLNLTIVSNHLSYRILGKWPEYDASNCAWTGAETSIAQILSWRLAVICEPPGDSDDSVGCLDLRHLAIENFPPNDNWYISGTWNSCTWRWGWFRHTVSAALGFLKRLAPGGTRPPPGSLEAAAPGGTCPPPGNFCCSSLWLLVLHAWSTRLLGYFKGRLASVPWVELGIGVKHVAFLELGSEWHPSSWARDGGWTWGTLKLSLGWWVLPVWVC